jgi:phosphohistidine swiveling domain-containing protein
VTRELRSALATHAVPGTIDLASRREWILRHSSAAALPAAWRGAPSRATAGTSSSRLAGLAASGGRFTGRARRIDGPGDTIGADEVLVAAATDPSWTPVLVRCGAMVVEHGGPLSHAAILAREFGRPAVFDVPGAVARLDGRLVRVDGDAGTVEVLDEGPAGRAEPPRPVDEPGARP